MAKKASTSDRHQGKPKVLRFSDEQLALFRKAAAIDEIPALATWMVRTLVLSAKKIIKTAEEKDQ